MAQRGGVRRPGATLPSLLLALLLTACSVTAPTASPGPSGGTTPGTDLAARLRDAVSIDAVLDDLDRLQQIADAHDGMRAAGSAGYDASVDFVARTLRALGYQVDLDPITLPFFTEVGDGVIEVPGIGAFSGGRDFRAMIFSASGDIRARVVAVGFDRSLGPGAPPTGAGCDGADLPAAVRGAILLVQPGPCYRRVQAEAAQAAGAVALVVVYPAWEPDSVLRPTLLSPTGIEIPVIGATRMLGLALDDASVSGASVHLRVTTTIVDRTATYVIAETAGGDPSRVVMLGAHLDSVIDGPGINDNGSGAMAILEVARRLASMDEPRLKVRVAFWAGEEIGFYGSRSYVEGLSNAERHAIRAYLNFDMLGSRNGARMVYADTAGAAGSERITQLFTRALEADGLASETMDVSGASDHAPFEEAGIPAGGLFSGANEVKSASQAERFGGTAGALFDPCYHRACDRADSLDAALLRGMVRAVAYVTGELAAGGVPVGG